MKDRVTDVGPVKLGLSQIGETQRSSGERRLSQFRLPEITVIQLALGKISPISHKFSAYTNSNYIQATKVGIRQIDTFIGGFLICGAWRFLICGTVLSSYSSTKNVHQEIEHNLIAGQPEIGASNSDYMTSEIGVSRGEEDGQSGGCAGLP